MNIIYGNINCFGRICFNDFVYIIIVLIYWRFIINKLYKELFNRMNIGDINKIIIKIVNIC